MINNYLAMGYNIDQVSSISGLSEKEINKLINPNSKENVDTINISDSDALYSIEELKKPGVYEILFRTPSTNSLLFSGDEEKKYLIDFSKFK